MLITYCFRESELLSWIYIGGLFEPCIKDDILPTLRCSRSEKVGGGEPPIFTSSDQRGSVLSLLLLRNVGLHNPPSPPPPLRVSFLKSQNSIGTHIGLSRICMYSHERTDRQARAMRMIEQSRQDECKSGGGGSFFLGENCTLDFPACTTSMQEHTDFTACNFDIIRLFLCPEKGGEKRRVERRQEAH